MLGHSRRLESNRIAGVRSSMRRAGHPGDATSVFVDGVVDDAAKEL